MYSLLLPDALFAFFKSLTVGMAWMGKPVVSLLCGVYFWAVAALVRTVWLRLDARISALSRSRAEMPPVVFYLASPFANILPRLTFWAAAVLVMADGLIPLTNLASLRDQGWAMFVGTMCRAVSDFMWRG